MKGNGQIIDGFEQVEDTSDFHCVTKWSRMDTHWGGVGLGEMIAAAEPADTARFVLCHGKVPSGFRRSRCSNGITRTFGNSAATRTPHILGAMTAILDNAQ